MSSNTELASLKYPIGKFEYKETKDRKVINKWINEIESLPSTLKEVVKGLSEEQLNTPYRPDGWTIKQVIHHIGDSHLNSYIRFKLALTEDKPIIKPYDQEKWADLPDYKLTDVSDSLDFIKILHKRWVILLRALSDEDLEREFVHPETGSAISVKKNIALYAWHSKHHLAHIYNLIDRMNWK